MQSMISANLSRLVAVLLLLFAVGTELVTGQRPTAAQTEQLVDQPVYFPLIAAPGSPNLPVTAIDLLLGEQTQPLDGSIAPTTTVTVRIRGDLTNLVVIHDRPDGRAGLNGAGLTITPRFTLVQPGLWQAVIPAPVGLNTIRITDATGSLLLTATALNYTLAFEDLNGNNLLDLGEDANGNGVLDPGEDRNGNGLLDLHEDLNGDGRLNRSEDLNHNGVLDPGEDLNGNGVIDPVATGVLADVPATPADFGSLDGEQVYSRHIIALHFVDAATDSALAAYLRARNLRPVGITLDDTTQAKAKTVYAAVPLGTDALVLVKTLNRLPVNEFPFYPASDALPVDPPLAVATPLLVTTPPRAAGEALPARLLNGAAAPPSGGNGGDGYQPATGGFDNDNDGGANDFDELNLTWHHFFMDTFAAHRLVDLLTAGVAAPTRPVVALVDTGLGDGTGVALMDIAANRIISPTDCATGVVCTVVGLNQIADAWTTGGLAGSHGTQVAHLTAGAGARVLGTGKDIAIRPIKSAGVMSYQRYAQGLRVALADPAVRVIVLEFQEGRYDRNGDGQVTNTVVGGVNELQAALNGLNAARAQWLPAINAALIANPTKILVIPAGNSGQNTDFSLLAGGQVTVQGNLQGLFNGPTRGGRAANAANSLLFGIGNATITAPPLGRELLAPSSNFGAAIGVVALSQNVPSLAPTQSFTVFGGTSGAAPQVAGLAGELIFLDQNVAAVGPFTPLQIIELIEATADDLGTNQANAPFINDNPGNGGDHRFGFGRLNAWKATLAAVNGGLAVESHPAGAGFATLPRIDDAATRWYGFKIHSPHHGSTIWIDGVQVTDAGSTAPGGITAYAGVRTDEVMRIGVPNEDPMSGIVPVGSASNYIATFSIERGDLLAGSPRTLSLRRAGQTAADAPFYNLELNLSKLRAGEVPGVVFDDFVFEVTLPDFGDGGARYPVTLADNGARHLQHTLEYFARINNSGDALLGASPELNVLDAHDPDGISNWGVDLDDLDGYDDGVTFYPLTYRPGDTGRADFTVCVAESGPRYSRTDPSQQIFVNAWIDWDTDGQWEEGASGEHIINGMPLAPITGTQAAWTPLLTTTVQISAAVSLLNFNDHCATYQAEFAVPGTIGKERLESRWRLDYGENVGRQNNRFFPHLAGLDLTRGPARYGEVEDYIIGADFGDASDPPHNTTKGRNGPRHLNFYREWIGPAGSTPAASHEPDACITGNSDQDGVDNLAAGCLGKNRDGLDNFTVTIIRPGRIRVDFTVSSTVRGYGFDGGNGGVLTMKPNCSLGAIAATPETPKDQRVARRYDAANPEERLYVNLWGDWDGDGAWEAHHIAGLPVDPEDFGADGVYTLGEAFTDTNGDGVWNPGEAFTDAAGLPARAFSCEFDAPVPVPPGIEAWVRLRLDYGENAGQFILRGQAHEEIPLHIPAGPDGGAVWGEVEDLPLKGPPDKRATPPSVTTGELIHYTIILPGNAALTTTSEGWIEDTLPEGVEYVGNLTCSSPGCSYSAETNTVRWQGELTADSLVTVEFDVRVPETWPLTWPPVINRARVYDGVTVTTLETTTLVDCKPTKRVSLPVVVPGQTFVYTLVLPPHPTLTEPAQVRLTDQLPPALQYRGDLTVTGGVCSYDSTDRTLQCTGAVPPGQQLVVTFSVAVRPDLPPSECPPSITNRAEMFDGVALQDAEATVLVLCEGG
jgi:hypothetical protein